MLGDKIYMLGIIYVGEHYVLGDFSQSGRYCFVHIQSRRGLSTTMRRIAFDPRGKDHPEYRVKHMTLVLKTLIMGEHEYLFAPY